MAYSSKINFSWTASSDNVGVTGYQIERCQGATCTNFAQIGTPTAASYSDTGVVANTTYQYRVRATDAAQNLSDYSSIVSKTTPVLSSGDCIQINGQNVEVRSDPGTVDTTVLGIVSSPVTGTVGIGPGGGGPDYIIRWWRVYYSPSLTGWTDETYLTKIACPVSLGHPQTSQLAALVVALSQLVDLLGRLKVNH